MTGALQDFEGVSADGNWVIFNAATAGSGHLNVTRMRALHAATNVDVCAGCQVQWANKGDFLYVRFENAKQTSKLYLLPIPTGKAFPAIFNSGSKSEDQVATLADRKAGVKVLLASGDELAPAWILPNLRLVALASNEICSACPFRN